MERPRIKKPADFLVDNGILFEINRQVLHPLGLQLELVVEEDGTVCEVVLEDNRNVAGPIYFTPEEFDAGRHKYEAYMNEHGRRNIQKRRQIGVVIQTGPNIPHHIHMRHDDEADPSPEEE